LRILTLEDIQKVIYIIDVDEKALFQRLDKIISLLEDASKQPSVFVRVLNMAALVISILGAITIIDAFRNWFGG